MSRARDDDVEVHVPLLQRNSLDQPYDDEAPPYSPPDPHLRDQFFPNVHAHAPAHAHAHAHAHPHAHTHAHPHAHVTDPPFLRLPFTNKFLRLPRFLRPPQRLHTLYHQTTTHPRFYDFQIALGRCRPLLICLLIFSLLLLTFTLYCTILFSPHALPPTTQLDMTTTTVARFLTLNIFLRPPGIRNNLSDYKDTRLEYLLEYILPQYEVVALQEAFAFGTLRRDYLIRRAREMGYNHFVESDRKNMFDLAIDGGLLILSKFEIVESDKLQYDRGVHNDWLAAKGGLYARIKLNPTTYLDLFTTHTQASYGHFPQLTDPAVITRFSQISRLYDFVIDNTGRHNEDAFSSKDPILLLGDFNVDASAHDTPPEIPSRNSSSEYVKMMSILRGDAIPGLRDVVHEHMGVHPITFGDVVLDEDGELREAETVLTAKADLFTVQSLDRALFSEGERALRIRGGQEEEPEQSTRYDIKVADARVDKCLVKDEVKDELPFTQVSDHYGISVLIELTPIP